MEKRMFRTLIKGNCLLGQNAFVQGMISGFQEVICNRDGENSYGMMGVKKGTVITTKCTELQYDAFRKMVEKHYPGVCEFDYELKV